MSPLRYARFIVSVGLVLGGCSSAGTSIDARGAETSSSDLSTAAPVPSTSGDATTTTGATAAWISTDVASLFADEDLSEFAELSGPILLPTELPSWVSESGFVAAAVVEADGYFLDWQIDVGEERELVRSIGLTRIAPQPGDFEMPTSEPVEGTRRTYWLTPGATSCDGFSTDSVLWWELGGYQFTVELFPKPGCAPEAVLDDAVRFADSTREYSFSNGQLVPASKQP
jgi:hypothetical protein